MITLKRKATFTKAKKRQTKAEAPAGRIPRIARLMALAIRFDQLIRDGVVADQAELARLGSVSRARLTQIMDLLLLAPDIQELLLLLPGLRRGRQHITERALRSITDFASWKSQRCAMKAILLIS